MVVDSVDPIDRIDYLDEARSGERFAQAGAVASDTAGGERDDGGPGLPGPPS